MNEIWQTVVALGLAVTALGYLLWQGLRRRGGGACSDGSCGCAKGSLKPKRK